MLGIPLPGGLRPLGHRSIVFIRFIWLFTLFAALAGLFAGNYYVYKRDVVAASALADFGLAYGKDVPVRLTVPLSDQAQQAGISEGDALVALNGKAIAESATPIDLAGQFASAGSSIDIVIRHTDGKLDRARLDRDPAHGNEHFVGTGMTKQGRDLIILIADTLVGVILLAAAVLLFRRRPHDPVAVLLSLAFLLLLASYSWAWLLESGFGPVERVLRPTAWILMTFLLFVFPTGRFDRPWTAAVAMLLPFAWLFWVSGISFTAQIIINVAFLALALIAMRARAKSLPPSTEQQQIKWAFVGFACALLCILVAVAGRYVVPVLISDLQLRIWAEAVVSLALVMMIAFIAMGLLVSLLRYRLYDAEEALSRTATYALVTLAAGTAFAAVEHLLVLLFSRALGDKPGLAGVGIAIVVAGLMVAPVHARAHHWAQKRFQHRLVHLKKELPELASDLRETAPVPILAKELLALLADGVRADGAALVMKDDGQMALAANYNVASEQVESWLAGWVPRAGGTHMDYDRLDDIFPVRMPLRDVHNEGGAPFGWILLGLRPDGSFYSGEEQEIIDEAAEPVARAIIVARQRAVRESFINDAIADFGARIKTLEVAIVEVTKWANPMRPQPLS
jgi:hypothetical protein